MRQACPVLSITLILMGMGLCKPVVIQKGVAKSVCCTAATCSDPSLDPGMPVALLCRLLEGCWGKLDQHIAASRQFDGGPAC